MCQDRAKCWCLPAPLGDWCELFCKMFTNCYNLVEVDHALVVLNLGDNLDVLALLPEDAADLRQRGAVADERREDHIHLILLRDTLSVDLTYLIYRGIG